MKEEKHCCDNCKYFKSYYVLQNAAKFNIICGAAS